MPACLVVPFRKECLPTWYGVPESQLATVVSKASTWQGVQVFCPAVSWSPLRPPPPPPAYSCPHIHILWSVWAWAVHKPGRPGSPSLYWKQFAAVLVKPRPFMLVRLQCSLIPASAAWHPCTPQDSSQPSHNCAGSSLHGCSHVSVKLCCSNSLDRRVWLWILGIIPIFWFVLVWTQVGITSFFLYSNRPTLENQKVPGMGTNTGTQSSSPFNCYKGIWPALSSSPPIFLQNCFQVHFRRWNTKKGCSMPLDSMRENGSGFISFASTHVV